MSAETCIFCKITAGQMGTEFLYEDDLAVVFRDLHPQAPVHLLVVPKRHIPDVDHLEDGDRELVGHLFRVAAKVAAEQGFAPEGYKLLVNNGTGGGQVIFHIHVHVLSGRRLGHVPA